MAAQKKKKKKLSAEKFWHFRMPITPSNLISPDHIENC